MAGGVLDMGVAWQPYWQPSGSIPSDVAACWQPLMVPAGLACRVVLGVSGGVVLWRFRRVRGVGVVLVRGVCIAARMVVGGGWWILVGLGGSGSGSM